MRTLLLVLLAAVVTQAISLNWSPRNADDYDSDQEWNNFKNIHSKTEEKLDKAMLSSVKSNKVTEKGSTFLSPLNSGKLPDEVDWRKEGYVTEVKNQGELGTRCLSGWAFSATGAIEGQHFRKTGKLVSLSEQNMIDCANETFKLEKCDGGFPIDAFEYVRITGGIDTEVAYPYWASEQRCRFKPDAIGATVTGFVKVEPTEDKLKEAIATVGPISVVINARLHSFGLYSRANGIYDDPLCTEPTDQEASSHAALVVGYGTENGTDYYWLKNSYGTLWGFDGYMKLARNNNNLCGIASRASYPLILSFHHISTSCRVVATMKLLLAVLFVAVTAQALKLKWSPSQEDKENYFDYNIDQEWDNFKQTQKRTFHSLDHELNRKTIFKSNLEIIKKHNDDYAKGLTTYKMGVNQFADMTEEEFNKVISKQNSLKRSQKERNKVLSPLSSDELPKSVDWRDTGCVTEVKNQGECKAGYAFSATGAIETQVCLKTGKLVTLSEQNLVDCVNIEGGCITSTTTENAYRYIMDHGINTEASYPYWDIDSQGCRFKNDSIGARIDDYVIYKGTEKNLQEAVALIGPVSVAFNYDTLGLRMYIEGIFDDPLCERENLHHVLVVGYGTEAGVDYWLVKNSWGEHWGESGYVRMARNKDNQCGLANEISWPIL